MPDDNKDVSPQEGLQKLLDKAKGDAMALAGELYSENYRLRGDKRELKAKVEALEKSLPPDGSVVLSKADSERWEAYKSLGKPDELTKLKAEHVELQGKVAAAERNNTLRSVAEVAGLKADVLSKLVTDAHAFEIKDEKQDGKDIKRAYIVIESDGKKEAKPLVEYAEQAWPEFMPALKPAEEVKGTPYLKQTKGEPPKPPNQIADEKRKLAASGDYAL